MSRRPGVEFRQVVEWLRQNCGPVIRMQTYRMPLAEEQGQELEPVLALEEVQRWLRLLGSGPVHHSQDSAAENCMAKLAEYGLSAGIPALDEKALPYCSADACKTDYDYYILLPFLVRLGYGGHPVVRSWFERRLGELLRTANLGRYAIYMDEVDKARVPASLREKRLYRPEFSQTYPLPSCYDFYTLAYSYDVYTRDRAKMDVVVDYLMDARFQKTPGGYLWDAEKRRHYAAGRGYLATLPLTVPVPEWEAVPETAASGKSGVVYPDGSRLMLFMEAGSRLPGVRQSSWFRNHLDHLLSYHTDAGRFRLPREYLQEKTGYYLYSGSHMGLAESRRSRMWLEVESTFRLVRLRAQLNTS